jgi:hypothetical protein
MWPTWSQAALAASVSCAIAFVLRRSRPTRVGDLVMPAAVEFALVAALYSIWRMARKLPLAESDGAVERAWQIVRVEEWLRLPSELSVQHFLLRDEWLGRLASAYYAGVHVPALVVFLIWLFARHRGVYPHWRNALALLTAACLLIRFVKVAPPRFLPELGYIDLAALHGMSPYGEVGSGVSAQFAAMPSLHVAWAAVIAFGMLAALRSPWRWLGMAHLVVTMLVVAGTGHHWWLDGVAALALLAVAVQLDTVGRRLLAGRSSSLPRPAADRPAADRPVAHRPPSAVRTAAGSVGGQEQLHDRDVEPVSELPSDLALDPDQRESAGPMERQRSVARGFDTADHRVETGVAGELDQVVHEGTPDSEPTMLA